MQASAKINMTVEEIAKQINEKYYKVVCQTGLMSAVEKRLTKLEEDVKMMNKNIELLFELLIGRN